MFGDEYQGVPIFYARQEFDHATRDRPFGTADALCCASEFIDCPFVVCNGDDIYGENNFKTLVEHLKNNDEGATIGFRLFDMLPKKGTGNRGIFDVENDYVIGLKEVLGIEKSRISEIGLNKEDSCSMNIFALPAETARLLKEELNKFMTENSGDRTAECYLPAELSKLLKDGRLKMKIYPAVDMWFGVTCPEDEEVVRKELEELSKN